MDRSMTTWEAHLARRKGHKEFVNREEIKLPSWRWAASRS